jgi:formylglycine-generating enzyme required for sulfatase activity
MTSSQENLSPPLLENFVYKVVTLNAQGKVIARAKRKSYFFVEALDNEIKLELVEIPAGEFIMGSPETEGDHDERPLHKVMLKSFFMGKYQITQAQWRVVANWPKVARDLNPAPAFFQGDDLPVEQIFWLDAQEFCARLSKHSGRNYRLPSEAEWEYACRAGSTTPFAFGETITAKIVNYDGSSPYGLAPQGMYRNKTVPVGSLGIANRFGLYDMHGNVWEWCLDIWHDNYAGAPNDGSAWQSDGNDSLRILRGGSWDYVGYGCRSAFRDRGKPELTSPFNGFRVVADGIGY